MPFELEDPNAFPGIAERATEVGHLTAEERELIGSDVEERDKFNAELAELERATKLRAASAEAEAREHVDHDADVVTARGAGRVFHGALVGFAAEEKKVANDPRLSAAGRADRLAAAGKTRDAEIQAGAALLDGKGDAVLRRYPDTPGLQPTAADSAEASVVLASFSIARPADFARRALAMLRMAIDSGVGTELRRRADTLLDIAFLPCLDRGALAPRPFESAWAGEYGRLAATTGLHLDIEHGTARHRRAVEVIRDAREAYGLLVTMAREAEHPARDFDMLTFAVDGALDFGNES